VVVQGDFTEPPEEIPALLRRLEGGADVVGSTVASAEGPLPRGVRWRWRALRWVLGRVPVPAGAGDPFSGFRAYRVQVLRRALAASAGKLLTREGRAASAELLLLVAPHTRRAEELPIALRYTRRQRATRSVAWPELREAWRLARSAAVRRAPAVRGAAGEGAGERPQPRQPGAQRKRGLREVDVERGGAHDAPRA
jgi:hypothetical protein